MSACSPIPERAKGSLKALPPEDSSVGPSRDDANPRHTSTKSLLLVNGIGRKYTEKFVSSGVSSLRELARIYRSFDSDKFESYLQHEVGIRHRKHRDDIIAWMEQDPEDIVKSPEMRITLSLEGNIGAGKTTFLKMLEHGQGRSTGSSRPLGKRLVPEPVDEWQNIPFSKGGMTHINALEHFYQDSNRYAYLFQNYVFMTRWFKCQRTAGFTESVRLLERSVWSDRMVFVKQLVQDNLMQEVELAVYDDMFSRVMKSHRDLLVPDGFVYLRVDPNVALERMAARNRHEESAVPLAYLEGLHQKHEDWFMSRKTVSDLLRGGPSSAAGQRLAAGIGAGRGGAMEGGLLDLALPERMPWRREAGEREGGAGTPWEEWRVGADEFLPSPPEDIAGEVYLLNPTGSVDVDGGGDNCQTMLRGIPYLNVEYNSHMNVTDPDTAAHITQKVDRFAEWVDKVRLFRELRGRREHSELHLPEKHRKSIQLPGLRQDLDGAKEAAYA